MSGAIIHRDRSQQQADPAHLATYRRLGLDPQLWPRSAGSWPGCIFTEAPVSLPAGQLRTRTWRGRACTGRVLFDRVRQSEVQGWTGPSPRLLNILLRAGINSAASRERECRVNLGRRRGYCWWPVRPSQSTASDPAAERQAFIDKMRALDWVKGPTP